MKGTPRRLKVSQVCYGHTPDRHRRPAAGHEKRPIDVKWSTWNGAYQIIDGAARFYAATQRGDSHIDAVVWS